MAACRPIYVVDDDAAVRHSLQFRLGAEGFDVATFASGAELMADNSRFDAGCIILDYMLPGMTGLELIDRLRAQGLASPIILMTSNPDDDMVGRSNAVGVTVIEKPFLGEAIDAVVRVSVV